MYPSVSNKGSYSQEKLTFTTICLTLKMIQPQTEYGFAIWVLTENDIYIVNTLLEDDFGEPIGEKMTEREKHVVMKRNFKVDIMPESVKMFISSKLVSSKYSS